MNSKLITHLNRNPKHLEALLAWDRVTLPWVAFTGSWWDAWSAAELRAAAEFFGAIAVARAAQRKAAEHIIAHGPDQRGATLGLFDQMAEELIIEGKI